MRDHKLYPIDHEELRNRLRHLERFLHNGGDRFNEPPYDALRERTIAQHDVVINMIRQFRILVVLIFLIYVLFVRRGTWYLFEYIFFERKRTCC